jgi:hypothetical protein
MLSKARMKITNRTKEGVGIGVQKIFKISLSIDSEFSILLIKHVEEGKQDFFP